ncbi:RNA polymerase sigma factor [Paractinoplanes rishiriensis]|uniref:RNA polymerase subunit sigma-24 n=1 Tax=Paractinoplanes rishiriensis TaxID=1050105 RepID=A0A919K3Q0_9ACTN|nr:sigma-70 family RNA polymerase sigma factor [Actinoplanes rishiriensis]GIE99628.1 RNA polymerase subunit sigma-24 [Actinoplanes rishiriensis]
MTVDQAVEQAYRDEWSRLLALLVTRLRRFDVAEDSLQDAFLAAARVWPSQGVPDRPAAWLWTTARRRALDRIRQETADARRLPLLLTGDPPPDGTAGDDEIPDERLRLLFACCHPALRPDARAALMLRFVAGLTTAEIARLFLVSEPTMSARLTRAKAKMAVAGIPLRAPAAADLPGRLDVVLTVIYLIFTEGYRATAGPDLLRPRLAAEAIRLGYLVGELLPGEPRTLALLALMLLQHARRDARVGAGGDLILLPDQDRGRWRQDEIGRGLSLLALIEAAPMAGEYHLQALIAAEHAKPPPTDWPRIAQLYAELERRTSSPAVRLNRAVAVAEAGAPEAALALLDDLDRQLPGNHLLPAARAELYARLGRDAEAKVAFERALSLVPTAPERAHLEHRLSTLTAGPG